MKKGILFFSAIFILSFATIAQGLIAGGNSSLSESFPQCGSYELMENIDQEHDGFLELSDQLLEHVNKVIKHQNSLKSNVAIYTIPVVFHVVYNNNQENIPDSVITDQLDILNKAFRRQNADTSNTRVDFKPLVGDSKIEFKLANRDPNGNPTNGITRTSTTVTNFGGVLPYGPGQNQQINQWVNDSLFYNYFRLTTDSLGGKDPWDTDRYLNVWMGDLRILEPQFNNFQELVFFALATPPANHKNWPPSAVGALSQFSQGVLIHYVTVGSNNPNSFPSAYQNYNGLVTNGDMLVHEVGHYLGLRHIWGDGNCTADDFIHDTPRSNASSNWTCNLNSNTCLDTINNLDLFNMVENYMDYSGGACQNLFTNGQIDLMRSVLVNYRPNVYDSTFITSITEHASTVQSQLKCFPNPTNGNLTIDLSDFNGQVQLSIQNNLGQEVVSHKYENANKAILNLDIPAGLYFVTVNSDQGKILSTKLIKQ